MSLLDTTPRECTADKDTVLVQVVNYGPDNAILHLDPDQTYSSWAAGLFSGSVKGFLLYLIANQTSGFTGVTPVTDLNFKIPGGQKIFGSSQGVSIVQLFFEELQLIFSAQQ